MENLEKSSEKKSEEENFGDSTYEDYQEEDIELKNAEEDDVDGDYPASDDGDYPASDDGDYPDSDDDPDADDIGGETSQDISGKLRVEKGRIVYSRYDPDKEYDEGQVVFAPNYQEIPHFAGGKEKTKKYIPPDGSKARRKNVKIVLTDDRGQEIEDEDEEEKKIDPFTGYEEGIEGEERMVDLYGSDYMLTLPPVEPEILRDIIKRSNFKSDEEYKYAIEKKGFKSVEEYEKEVEKELKRFEKEKEDLDYAEASGKNLSELAQRLGVQRKVMKLIPRRVQVPTKGYILQYPHQFMIIGPSGKLEPPQKPIRTARLISDEEHVSIFDKVKQRKFGKIFHPKEKLGTIYEPGELEVPESPDFYHGPIKFGSRVEFIISVREENEVVILKADDVSVKFVDVISKKIKEYKNEYIKYINSVSEYPNKSSNGKNYVELEGVRYYLEPSKGDLKPSSLVKIDFQNFKEIFGVVVGFKGAVFEVSGEDGLSYSIPFTDPTIQISKEKPTRKISKMSKISKILPEYDLMSQPVDMLMRKYARDRLFRHFSKVIPGVKLGLEEEEPKEKMKPGEMDILRNAVKPWRDSKIEWVDDGKKWVVSWVFDNKDYTREFPVLGNVVSIDPPVEVEAFAQNSYYDENLRNWKYARYHKSVDDVSKNHENSEFFRKKAKEIHDSMSDKRTFVSQITDKYGREVWGEDGHFFREKMKVYDRKKGINIFDIFLKTKFERMSNERLNMLKGNELFIEINIIIQEYLRTHRPESIENIASNLRLEWVWEELNKINLDKKEIKTFNKENVENMENPNNLIRLYGENIKKYDKAVQKSLMIQRADAKSKEDRRKVKDEIDKYLRGTKDMSLGNDLYENITDIGYKLFKDVEKFEADCYAASKEGSTTLDYLTKMFYPVIFLESPLDEYAKFFKSKLATGHILVSALSEATLPYYFPELAVNFSSLSDRNWNLAIDQLSLLLFRKIKYTMRLYIGILGNVLVKETQPDSIGVFSWEKYVTSLTGKCQQDTGTGRVVKRDSEGHPEYIPSVKKHFIRDDTGKIVGTEMEKILIPKYTDIKDADLVICYDEKSDKFTCHSLRELFIQIRRSKDEPPVNPYTRLPYPSLFVEKIKKRYPEEVEKDIDDERELLHIESEKKINSDIFSSSEETQQGTEEDKDEEEIVTHEPKSLRNVKELMEKVSETKNAAVYVYHERNKKLKEFDKKWEEITNQDSDYDFYKINKDRLQGSEFNVRKVPTILILSDQNGKIIKLKTLTFNEFEKELKKRSK